VLAELAGVYRTGYGSVTSRTPIMRITSILVGTILAAAFGLLGSLGPAHRSSSAQAAAGPQGEVNYLDPTFGEWHHNDLQL